MSIILISLGVLLIGLGAYWKGYKRGREDERYEHYARTTGWERE